MPEEEEGCAGLLGLDHLAEGQPIPGVGPHVSLCLGQGIKRFEHPGPRFGSPGVVVVTLGGHPGAKMWSNAPGFHRGVEGGTIRRTDFLDPPSAIVLINAARKDEAGAPWCVRVSLQAMLDPQGRLGGIPTTVDPGKSRDAGKTQIDKSRDATIGMAAEALRSTKAPGLVCGPVTALGIYGDKEENHLPGVRVSECGTGVVCADLLAAMQLGPAVVPHTRGFPPGATDLFVPWGLIAGAVCAGLVARHRSRARGLVAQSVRPSKFAVAREWLVDVRSGKTVGRPGSVYSVVSVGKATVVLKGGAKTTYRVSRASVDVCDTDADRLLDDGSVVGGPDDTPGRRFDGSCGRKVVPRSPLERALTDLDRALTAPTGTTNTAGGGIHAGDPSVTTPVLQGLPLCIKSIAGRAWKHAQRFLLANYLTGFTGDQLAVSREAVVAVGWPYQTDAAGDFCHALATERLAEIDNKREAILAGRKRYDQASCDGCRFEASPSACAAHLAGCTTRVVVSEETSLGVFETARKLAAVAGKDGPDVADIEELGLVLAPKAARQQRLSLQSYASAVSHSQARKKSRSLSSACSDGTVGSGTGKGPRHFVSRPPAVGGDRAGPPVRRPSRRRRVTESDL
jgi:hypothetical protein